MQGEPGNDMRLGEILGHGGQLKLTYDRNGKHQRGENKGVGSWVGSL